MSLQMMKILVFVSLLVLTVMLLACQGSGEASESVAPTAVPDSGASGVPQPDVDSAPTVLGDCGDGLVMQPGEGCHYTGEEGRPADVVIAVGTDGSICREKGSVMMSGFMVGINSACADHYEVIDVLEAEINFEKNDDGSWTVRTN